MKQLDLRLSTFLLIASSLYLKILSLRLEGAYSKLEDRTVSSAQILHSLAHQFHLIGMVLLLIIFISIVLMVINKVNKFFIGFLGVGLIINLILYLVII